jgi:hypothetical protein
MVKMLIQGHERISGRGYHIRCSLRKIILKVTIYHKWAWTLLFMFYCSLQKFQ